MSKWRRLLLPVAALLLATPAPLLAADPDLPSTNPDRPSQYLDFTENDIQAYDPRDSLTLCNEGGEPVAGFSPDPTAVTYFEQNIQPKMSRLIPLYQRAAGEEDFADWQLLAGLHHMETNSSMTNPSTNPDFRGPFQMSAASLSRAGISPYQAPFDSGRTLSDDEFVTHARAAIKIFLRGKAGASTVNVDVSKALSVEEAMKLTIAYKSGEASAWLTGDADPNLHAYAWSGFDSTPQHAMPMAWGPGSPWTDEVPGSRNARPGALTVWGMLKSGDIGSLSGVDCVGAGGALQPISGSRAELVDRAINNDRLQLGNYGNAATQASDIRNVISTNLLVALVAMLEQSGADIPVNAIKSDHTSPGLHDSGNAIDIGYFGNGSRCVAAAGSPPCNSSEGNQLYNFLYTNWKQLKIVELIWQDPPAGKKCIGENGPVDCYAYYGYATMGQHYHHIHVGVKKQ
jgi:hypothetical protein